MKPQHMQMKPRSFSKATTQQVIYELKHKVVIALNKLADRDTYQIAVDDLEKTVECLTPDGIAPFLSCILDTDSEQKSAVRKECIRLIGVVVKFHEDLIGSHLTKMVTSVVKRLKDPDSVVRDSCVETMGVLASTLSKREDEADGIFVVLVKPLFEALGEQNKQVQAGAALCLARIIDQTCDPPVAILQRMLTRTIKLLKSPHYKAKPAVVELNRSIILAGGAPSQSVLSAAMASIQEALKNSDWTTRKAASMALGEIASSGGSFLALFKASCIRSLESCRFDKVKPVRDVVLHALHYWKSLPGSDASEPSETGSSMKENFCGGDYSDITSNTDSGRKNITFKKMTKESANKRSIPLSLRKAGQNYTESPQPSKSDDWQIEIAVPKTTNGALVHLQNEDSEGSSVTKTIDRMSTDFISIQDAGFDYVTMDDKQECSSVSHLVTDKAADNFHTKFLTLSCESGLHEPVSRNHRFEEIRCEEQLYDAKMQDRRSLDSTVTESSGQAVLPMHGSCCSQIANEMVFIRNQLLDVQNKQSNLMDLMQVFSTTVMDSLSALQSKVLGLEQVVEKITHDVEHGGRYPDFVSSKIAAQRSSISSPRLSSSTPRPSVDICNRQPSLLSVKKSEEDKSFTRSRLSGSSIQSSEMWTNSTDKKITRNFAVKDVQKNSGQETQMRKNNGIFAYAEGGQNNSAKTNGLVRQRVKGFLCEGDLDSAFGEALCCDNEHVFFELLNRTGPVLESLSHKTANDVLGTLACYVTEQRYMNYITPWLQQVVELSAVHGANRLGLSVKTKREFFFAIQEAVGKEFSNPAERRSVTQLAMRLRQVWGICA